MTELVRPFISSTASVNIFMAWFTSIPRLQDKALLLMRFNCNSLCFAWGWFIERLMIYEMQMDMVAGCATLSTREVFISVMLLVISIHTFHLNRRLRAGEFHFGHIFSFSQCLHCIQKRCMWFAELSVFGVVFITFKQSCKGWAIGADAITDNKYGEFVVNHTFWVEPRCR